MKLDAMKADAIKMALSRAHIICLLAVWALAGAAIPAWGGDTHAVVDTHGRTVRIQVPVRRMVVMSENAMEVLRVLDAVDRVVGVSDYVASRKDFWPELAGIPSAGNWSAPNYELIASLQPDLVIFYGGSPGPEGEKKLHPLGIQVLRLDFYRTRNLLQDVGTLGLLLDRKQEADTFIQWHRNQLDRIRALIPAKARRPRVFMEGYADYKTWGPGSGGNDMCLRAGGLNIAGELATSSPIITPEWVMSHNPDVIVKTPSMPNAYSDDDALRLARVREKILRRPGWEHLAAVKTGRVYVLSSDIAAGPSEVVGITYLAKWFFPERCRALDPEALHREYLERFQKIPYRGFYAAP